MEKINSKLPVLEESKKQSLPTYGLTEQQAVQQALTSSGKTYDVFINNTPKGHIPVVDRATGRAGYVPIGEYTPTLFIKA